MKTSLTFPSDSLWDFDCWRPFYWALPYSTPSVQEGNWCCWKTGSCLKRLMFLQTCVTWITRIRQGTPPSCWQPSLPWKQRRTCKSWKSSSPVGMWTPKPARWVHLLAGSVLAGIAVTCTSAPAMLLTTEHSPCAWWPNTPMKRQLNHTVETSPFSALHCVCLKPCARESWVSLPVSDWEFPPSTQWPLLPDCLQITVSSCLHRAPHPGVITVDLWPSSKLPSSLLSWHGPSKPKGKLTHDFRVLWSHSSQEVSFSMTATTQIRSVAQSCLTLCDPMNPSTPGLPVHHQLPEFTQTHVHRVSDAIQPSHPLSFASPLAPNPSQHQSLFQWVNSSHEVAKVLEFQL